MSLIAHLFTIKYASLQAGTVYCLYRLCYVDAGYNKPGPCAGVKNLIIFTCPPGKFIKSFTCSCYQITCPSQGKINLH